jgi:hypothetical protein
VKKSRSSQIQERPAAPRPAPAPRPADPAPQPPGGFAESWFRFWFTPADPVGLHVLRLLGGLLILWWLLGYAGHLTAFFGLDSLFDLQALKDATQMREQGGPPVTWSVLYLAGRDPLLLHIIYGLSLLAVALFTFGVATRLTAVLTWVVVVSFQANLAVDYDGDALLSILAFYLMVGHLLMGWSRPYLTPLARFTGPLLSWPLGERGGERPPSAGANAALRLIQIHFALVMVTSALHKLTFPDWWSGVAPWYSLHPGLTTTVAQARDTALGAKLYLILLSLAACAALAWQYAFPPQGGWSRARLIALGAAALAWAGGTVAYVAAPLGTDLYLAVLTLATYAGLAWQLAFPAFAWRPRARALLLGGAAVGWLACALVWGLPLIGPAVMIFCLAYVTPREWHWIGNQFRRFPGTGEIFDKVFGPRPEKTVAQRS